MRIGFQGLQLNFLPRDGVGEEEDNWLRLASYQREGATLGRLECEPHRSCIQLNLILEVLVAPLVV